MTPSRTTDSHRYGFFFLKLSRFDRVQDWLDFSLIAFLSGPVKNRYQLLDARSHVRAQVSGNVGEQTRSVRFNELHQVLPGGCIIDGF